MNEREFISLIDCRFPYHDRTEAERLIALGCSISSNAAFMIVEEIVRVPASVAVTAERRLDLLQKTVTRFDHPLKNLILSIAQQVIGGNGLALEQTICAMDEVAAFPNQFCALSVVYSSATEPWEEVERVFQQIVENWKAAATQALPL